jgi:predicted transglutaminase-like cysteine proteinase
VIRILIRYGMILIFLLGCSGRSAQPAVQKEAVPEETQQSTLPKAKGEDYFAQQRFNALERLILELQGKTDLEKLKGINDFFNRVRFVSDREAWGTEDYWARPSEFLRRDQGDCEDFVIAKFFALRRLGVAEEKLYFTYVKALKLNQAHMVLTYYETPKSVPLVLDNLNYLILPAIRRKDLAYVYSFNADSLFLNTQRGRGRTIEGGTVRNKKWAAFLKRIEKDGL